jgi:hypothetical protein
MDEGTKRIAAVMNRTQLFNSSKNKPAAPCERAAMLLVCCWEGVPSRCEHYKKFTTFSHFTFDINHNVKR